MLLLLHLQRVELDYVFKAKKVNALVRSEIRGLESAQARARGAHLPVRHLRLGQAGRVAAGARAPVGDARGLLH